MYAFPVDRETIGWPSSVMEQLSIVTMEPKKHKRDMKLYTHTMGSFTELNLFSFLFKVKSRV